MGKKDMKLSDAQIDALGEILKQEHTIYLLCGAVGSGKTMLSALAFGMLIQERAAEGQVLCIGYTRASFTRNVRAELEKFGIIDIENSKKEKFKILEYEAGIHGAYDERRASVLRGANASLVLVDELTRVHEEVFQELMRRLRKGVNPCIIATTNPDSPSSWVYEKLIKKPPSFAKVINLAMDDNPALSESYKERLKDLYADTPFLYDRFVLGKWVVGAGKIYDFSQNICSPNDLDEILERYWEGLPKIYWGVDFGMRNPTALVKCIVTPDKEILVSEEIYISNVSKVHTVSSIAQIIAEKCTEGVLCIDPSAAVLKDEILHQHQNISVRQTDNDVISGIRLIQNLSSQKKIWISNQCKNLIAESENYSWKKATEIDEKEKVVKKDDHCVDALRYACLSALPQLRKGIRKNSSSESIEKFIYSRKLF